MPSALPEGDVAPQSGELPDSALAGFGSRAFGFYVHVPFCSVRCGYCDFNTYTAAELGGGASRGTYADTAVAEVRFAQRVVPRAEVSTVFFGGGTPTLLPPSDLARILRSVDDGFGLAIDAEVTTESNPDSVTQEDLQRLRESGVNRISFGMQSSVHHVLRTLDRTHDPDRVPRVVTWAREAGFEKISLDLIYGTPGESLDAALACEPDHVSAYALIVEDGTQLARRVRRGELSAPDDDDLADKYLLADEVLGKAGLSWYEVSNWASSAEQWCRHNLLYWRGGDWWGIGPGAHSHVGGVRWWNVKHPVAYAESVAAGVSPAQAREVLDAETRRVERILLETRLVEGLDTGLLTAEGRSWLPDLVTGGLIEDDAGTVLLTSRGRLMADAVVRDLVG